MGYVVDFIIVVIALSVVINAWKKGFIKSIAGLVTGVVSFIVAYAFTPMLGNYIYNNF